MKCPACGQWVPGRLESCPACKLDVSLLWSTEDLRAALRRARLECDQSAARLAELGDHLSTLESLIIAGLRPKTPIPPAPAPAGEPKTEPLEPIWVEESVGTPGERGKSEHRGASPHPVGPPYAASVPYHLSRETEVRLGQKWLLIVGLVITVLAVGYFLKYSFDRNWVGPAGRVSMAYLAGIGMLATGEGLRRKRFDVFGLYLMGGGIAVLYFAGYAAFQIYHLFSQPLAFGLVALVTVFAGLLSLASNQIWLAVLGLIGGFLTPVILSTGTDNQIALMTYMVILNGGVLAIASFKQWRLLNYLGLGFTWLVFSGWYAQHYAGSKFWTTTIFLNLFFLIYACVPFVFYFVQKTRRRITGFALTIPNTFIAFGYSFATIRSYSRLEMVSIATVAYAVIFLGMATYLHRRNRENLDAFVLLLAKGLLFLVISVPLIFSRHWITVFWGVQGVVLLWAALRLTDARLRTGAVALLTAALCKFVLHDYVADFRLDIGDFAFPGGGFTALMLERWVATVMMLGVLLAAARMLKSSGFDSDGLRKNLAGLFTLFFGALLFLSLNVEVASFFHQMAPRARFASISVLWALYAGGLMALGFLYDRAVLRRCAIGLFAATVLKVFIRDMANVETPFRILSFLAVGLLLVGASYMYHRFAARILTPPTREGNGET